MTETQQWGAIIVGAMTAATPGFLAWMQTRRTHVAINSRMDELLTLTKKQSASEGREEGVAAEKAAQALREEGAKQSKLEDPKP